MKRLILILTGIILAAMLAGCGVKENTVEVPLFDKQMIVGTNIAFDDITDFYYTKENINYDAYYQRYRFYVEDGRHLFFHETRVRPGDYGPCTEKDTIQIGTIELSAEQWTQFCDLVSGGAVKARSESADSGDSGPWLYLYWTNDRSKYQQFSFDSYEKEAEFEEYCVALESKIMYRLSFNRSGFETEKTMYAPGEEVTVRYDIIATDTDYSFYSNDVEFRQEYDGGYVFTFVMPDHNVALNVKSRNTMEYDPDANIENTSGNLKDHITNENMVFDYYEAVEATVGGDESTEYVLYEYDDTQLILARYNKEEDSEETMDYCLVSSSVLDDSMELVRKYKMANWKKGTGLRGMTYVVRFMNDGEMVRISSDDMPEDGSEAFNAIREVLSGEWGNAVRGSGPGIWYCPECGCRNEGRYCSECGLEKPAVEVMGTSGQAENALQAMRRDIPY